MSTEDGAHCSCAIQCGQTDKPGIACPGAVDRHWNACYLGGLYPNSSSSMTVLTHLSTGRQFFHHDKIGDFSIQFDRAGGIDGETEDGLHHPKLRLADINNWDTIDVQDLADKGKEDDHEEGNLCGWESGSKRSPTWKCGVPWTGVDGGFGFVSNSAVHQSTFAPGWCTLHMIQYQKNQADIGNAYAFSLVLKDNDKKIIGQITKQPLEGTAPGVLNMPSNLPYMLVLKTRDADDDWVQFEYSADRWNTNPEDYGGRCTSGGFENGNRESDCGFQCNAA